MPGHRWPRSRAGLGVLLQQQGELGAAVRLFERSLAIWRGPRRPGAAGTRTQQPRRHPSSSGRPGHREIPAGGQHRHRPRAWRAASGSRAALTNLGQMESEAGNFDRATQLLQESLALDREHGDLWGMALDQQSLGGDQPARGPGRGRPATCCPRCSTSPSAPATPSSWPEPWKYSPASPRTSARACGRPASSALPTASGRRRARPSRYPTRPCTSGSWLPPSATIAPEDWEAELAAGRALSQQQAATLLASPSPARDTLQSATSRTPPEA